MKQDLGRLALIAAAEENKKLRALLEEALRYWAPERVMISITARDFRVRARAVLDRTDQP